jgi:hypothetical protein
MESEEYDFTRNPVVENEVFFLESKCVHCGFAVRARSLEELHGTRRTTPDAIRADACRVLAASKLASKSKIEKPRIEDGYKLRSMLTHLALWSSRLMRRILTQGASLAYVDPWAH